MDVESIYIEIDENLKLAELYWETEQDRDAIDITNKMDEILSLLPKEYEYETLDN